MTQTSLPVTSSARSCGGHLVTDDGRTLLLRSTRLVVTTAGGIAAVKVVQTFANPFTETLQVRYLLPLPADAAVSGFAFTIGARRIQGQIDRKAAARERFERALVEGRTAGLLEQERSALFIQELGNIPAGAQITAEVDVDQPLVWAEGQWEWRFPTAVAPRYLGGEGRVPDSGRIEVPLVETTVERRLQVELRIDDALAPGSAITSPSHAVHGEAGQGPAHVRVTDAAMDRDVVVRWRTAVREVGLGLRVARPEVSCAHSGEAYGLLTLVPPAPGHTMARVPRDLILLLDISGSMDGQPLAAAQRVSGELIRSLDTADRLELIAFSTRPQPWLGAPCFATEGNKAAALKWLASLHASGGTEMRDAILAALQPLRSEAQRQVVLVTDGLIGFESEITAAISNGLPAGSRVHVVGIGDAPNRTLTRGASRAGRGLEVLIGLNDDVSSAARRLLERTAAPLVTNLEVAGSALLGVVPQAIPDVFAGSPVRLGLRLRPEGGRLVVLGRAVAGTFRHEFDVAPTTAGVGDACVSRLVGREWVEDLETAIAANGCAEQHGAVIERIGLEFAISTRATSWVAIDDQVGNDPRDPRRVVELPHELAHGMSVTGLGLRQAMPSSAAKGRVAYGGAAELAALPAAAPMRTSKSMRVDDEAADDMLIKEESPRYQGGPHKKAKPGEPGGPSQPHAILRLRNAAEWVFDLHGLVQWTEPRRVVLVFADGSEVTVDVVVERSTRATAIASGAVVKLVLRANANLPQDAPTHLRLGEGSSAIPVRAA